MLLEVEVTAGANSPLDVHRMFDLLSDPSEVHRVLATDSMGQDVWCQVTGWGTGGPCSAMTALSEDSGEGVVLLVYGGDEGIRLKPADSAEDWDLASSAQWGEACLMLGKDTPFE
jgi:hypothetical protein